MIYEYRVYETLPGMLPNLHARFRDHTTKIFERHGIKNIGYWTSEVGDFSDRLIYIVAFEDAGQRQRAWESFRNDPEWQKVRAESEANGLIVKRVSNSLLNPTDYSPLQ
ncbi:MAG: NIPSNAP family protein [SAR202 cluster bacterium Casp-Chloro-G4]|nr:NIPSNAP family protein [Chloroflexota bacterium]MDA1226926.1 NIPSNAP family protein [Chloroflexota bacterium]PKB61957.1 MAG: NIPSNAP family protein [SAR202 cluster bacterium Casp-Chloro-G4]